MDFITSCGCLKCCLSSDKGSYSTYDRERNQASRIPIEKQQVESNDSTLDSRKECQQTSRQLESPSPKNMGKLLVLFR